MAIFKWHNEDVPQTMKITQVYGIIFFEDGRVLLKIDKKDKGNVYSFAGGTPEAFDKDIEATLRRELIEEVNVEIDTPIYIGYQEVDEEDGTEKYAQVRMAAKIKKINEKKPDPDNGRTYDRLLTSPENAINFLNWGVIAEQQISRALQVARDELNIKEAKCDDKLV